MNHCPISPMPGFVVIEPLEEEQTTSSGLVLPDDAKNEMLTGTVLSVGEPKDEVTPGDYIAPSTIIYYKKYTGHSVLVQGREYKIVEFSNIIAKLS